MFLKWFCKGHGHEGGAQMLRDHFEAPQAPGHHREGNVQDMGLYALAVGGGCCGCCCCLHLNLNWGRVFFPTCQVRVVRFYVCSRLLLVLLLLLLLIHLRVLRLRRHPRRHLRQTSTSTRTSRLQWAAPDLTSELQIAVGSAGPQEPAPDCSGQRRASTGGPWSRLGSAGPQPGGSGAEWAAPDLSSQKMCQKICQKYVRQECQKECQKICQKKMSDGTQKNCPKICQEICQ